MVQAPFRLAQPPARVKCDRRRCVRIVRPQHFILGLGKGGDISEAGDGLYGWLLLRRGCRYRFGRVGSVSAASPRLRPAVVHCQTSARTRRGGQRFSLLRRETDSPMQPVVRRWPRCSRRIFCIGIGVGSFAGCPRGLACLPYGQAGLPAFQRRLPDSAPC